MRLKIGILFLFITFNCFAHKDKVIEETYGNVKVYMRTGFDYLDIDKIKIVGQLSEKLSNRLKYKDTIFIEYIQDYTNQYSDDLYILEYNNSNYKLLGGIKSEYTIDSNNNGLSVRMYVDRINIINTLKLIEFTINNKERTNSYLKKKTIGYTVDEYQDLEDPLISLATDDDLINNVISSESELIDNLKNEKILVNGQDPYGIEIYWVNNKFIFEYNHIWKEEQEFLFEIDDYYYHVYVNMNQVLIFIDNDNFYFLGGTDEKEKQLNKISNGSYAPIRVMTFGNKLLIYNIWNRNDLNIFLKDKNKVISKFE